MRRIATLVARSFELFTLVVLDQIQEVTTGIEAREALVTDPLAIELSKLGIHHADMDHIVQRAARLEAHGITDQDVDRIVRDWYRERYEYDERGEGQ